MQCPSENSERQLRLEHANYSTSIANCDLMRRAWTSIYIFLCKYRLVASHLHHISSATMQAAASTNTITNTATPASRPGSVDEPSLPADKNYLLSFPDWQSEKYIT